jgi:hypothetical protein
MNATEKPRRTRLFTSPTRQRGSDSPSLARRAGWRNAILSGLLFLLAIALLFCHGCHGPDVDDDLGVLLPPRQKGP